MVCQASTYYVYNSGGPKPNLHFIWKVDEDDDESNLINKCCSLIRQIEREVPFMNEELQNESSLMLLVLCQALLP